MPKIELKDYSKEVLEEIYKIVPIALKAVGQEAEGYAKQGCPVDTGNLRNSITNTVVESDVYIGTNVEYAPYVEYGDKAVHKTGGAHFLRNAACDHIDRYKAIMEAAFKI